MEESSAKKLLLVVADAETTISGYVMFAQVAVLFSSETSTIPLGVRITLAAGVVCQDCQDHFVAIIITSFPLNILNLTV